jgi:hypothetical protein
MTVLKPIDAHWLDRPKHRLANGKRTNKFIHLSGLIDIFRAKPRPFDEGCGSWQAQSRRPAPSLNR